MRFPRLSMATGPRRQRGWLVMLVAALVGLGMGVWLIGPETETVERLEAEVAQREARLQAAPAPVRAQTLPEPAAAHWPAAADAATVWPGLQQRLQAHGLQLLSLRPQPIILVNNLPEQAVLLRLQGRWDDWLALERAFAAHAPWWGMDQWQAVPAGTAAQEVQIELQARLGLLPPALLGATPAAWAWPTWTVEEGLRGSATSLFGIPAASSVTVSEAATVGAAANQAVGALSADPRQWPVRELRLLGVWQQAGAARAVLGAGLNQVVVAPGQSAGLEGWRVRRVGQDSVELQAAGAHGPVLHLTLRGDKP